MLLLTARLRDSDGDGIIEASSGKPFNLGTGSTLALISDGGKAIRAIEYDGEITVGAS
ncbi:hypothetical protein AB5I41_08190 [Sphingomonas sp. MMS24-JH45]